jgi:transcriptional/translational regulatory protein YebC/TACO1
MIEQIQQKIIEGFQGIQGSLEAGLSKLTDNKEMTVGIRIKIVNEMGQLVIDGSSNLAFTQKEKYEIEPTIIDSNQPDLFKGE